MQRLVILAASGAVLVAVLCGATAGDFETPGDEPPEASLAPTQVAGESFHVQSPVHSDGLMHHYVVDSRFGVFPAYGRDALALRVREVAALTTIARTSDTEVVFKSVSRGIEDDARSLVQVALDPVGTVIGIPKGIGHLLGGYRAQAEEVAAEVRPPSRGDGSRGKAQGSGRAEQAERAAKRYADRYLGLSAAERRWYAQLRVDPYTSNEVLRRAVRRLARIDAAASFGVRFAPVGVPFAGEVRRALDTIYNEDPAVLRKRRREALAGYGLTPSEIESFENTLLLTPTRQTLLADAVKALEGVEGRAELLRQATAVTAEDEIEVFLNSACLLVHFHSRRPLARVLSGLRVPAAQLADGRVTVFGAFDDVQWTEEVAAYERALREGLPRDAPMRELWLAGALSPRAHTELARLGWEVHDRAAGSLACASGETPASTAPLPK